MKAVPYVIGLRNSGDKSARALARSFEELYDEAGLAFAEEQFCRDTDRIRDRVGQIRCKCYWP